MVLIPKEKIFGLNEQNSSATLMVGGKQFFPKLQAAHSLSLRKD